MEFTKLGSKKKRNINIAKYIARKDKDCRSKFQKTVKAQLMDLFPLDIWLEEFRIPGSLMTIDLVNLTKKLAIEVQGEQHEGFNPFFHDKNIFKFGAQMDRDRKKFEWCQDNNLIYCEIYKEDLPLSKKIFKERYGLDF